MALRCFRRFSLALAGSHSKRGASTHPVTASDRVGRMLGAPVVTPVADKRLASWTQWLDTTLLPSVLHR